MYKGLLTVLYYQQWIQLIVILIILLSLAPPTSLPPSSHVAHLTPIPTDSHYLRVWVSGFDQTAGG